MVKQNLNKLILPASISFDRFKSTDTLVLVEKNEFLNKSANETTNSNNADTISSLNKIRKEIYMNQSPLINPLEKQTKDGNLFKKSLKNFVDFVTKPFKYTHRITYYYEMD